MSRVVEPLQQRFDGQISVPGSKSVANRALICAALAIGESSISNLPTGDDTEALLTALPALGVGVVREGTSAVITGCNRPQAATVHARLAGTSSRFLVGFAALGEHPISVDGDEPLRRRPLQPLLDALRQLQVAVEAAEERLPVTLTGPAQGNRVQVSGDISSQFISALMMIGPRLESGLTIELTSNVVSQPYVELTASVMNQFGAAVTLTPSAISIPADTYVPSAVHVEADASSASYPLALAAISGSRCTIESLGSSSRQGDVAILDILERMGCMVVVESNRCEVIGPAMGTLNGIDINMANCSDLVPTVATIACLARTPSTISGVGFIRAKESDRLSDLASELRKAGAIVDVTKDGLHITPAVLHGAEFDTHHDHRLAMSFGVLGHVIPGVVVQDPDVVSKSWPTFWSDIHRLVRADA